jgi:hypothetical protein
LVRDEALESRISGLHNFRGFFDVKAFLFRYLIDCNVVNFCAFSSNCVRETGRAVLSSASHRAAV